MYCLTGRSRGKAISEAGSPERVSLHCIGSAIPRDFLHQIGDAALFFVVGALLIYCKLVYHINLTDERTVLHVYARSLASRSIHQSRVRSYPTTVHDSSQSHSQIVPPTRRVVIARARVVFFVARGLDARRHGAR